MKKLYFIGFLLPFLFLNSCKKDEDLFIRGNIVSHDLVLSTDKAGVQEFMDDFDPAVKFLFPPDLGVEIHKVIYETIDASEEPTTASGIIVIPKGNSSYPLVSYQHGTIVEKEEAPSRLKGEFLVGLGMSTDGYITIMADYLGLGDSDGLHPYVHSNSEASASLDMIRAGKNLLEELSVSYNDQLFLVGYSQGGHSTAALQKEIESFHQGEFTITASAPMSGPYDISGTMAETFQDTATTSAPYYLPYSLLAYNDVYELFPSNDDIFEPPYNTTIPSLFDGTHSSSEINNAMPDAPIDIVKEELVQLFNSDPNFPLKLKLEENDLLNWAPQAPTRIYYCEDDELVNKQNSIVAYNSFVDLGAPDVQLINKGPGLGHEACAIPSLRDAKDWFDTLKK